jgi:hypothetical protein
MTAAESDAVGVLIGALLGEGGDSGGSSGGGSKQGSGMDVTTSAAANNDAVLSLCTFIPTSNNGVTLKRIQGAGGGRTTPGYVPSLSLPPPPDKLPF